MLLDGSITKSKEAMDIGAYYYVLKGATVIAIKKTDVAQIEWRTKTQENDSSKYVRGDDGSCTTGKC